MQHTIFNMNQEAAQQRSSSAAEQLFCCAEQQRWGSSYYAHGSHWFYLRESTVQASAKINSDVQIYDKLREESSEYMVILAIAKLL